MARTVSESHWGGGKSNKGQIKTEGHGKKKIEVEDHDQYDSCVNGAEKNFN